MSVNGTTALGTVLNNTVVVASDTIDPNPANNTAVFPTLVVDNELTSSNGTEITGVEGSSTGTVLLGSFRDANQSATIADFTTPPGSVVVNWGDGSAPQTLGAGEPHHQRLTQRRGLQYRRCAHLYRGGYLRVHGHGDLR